MVDGKPPCILCAHRGGALNCFTHSRVHTYINTLRLCLGAPAVDDVIQLSRSYSSIPAVRVRALRTSRRTDPCGCDCEMRIRHAFVWGGLFGAATRFGVINVNVWMDDHA